MSDLARDIGGVINRVYGAGYLEMKGSGQGNDQTNAFKVLSTAECSS